MDRTDEEIRVVSKLMDETEDTLSPLAKVYDELYNLLSEKIATVLDEGLYPDNSTIVRQLLKTMQENEIFTVLPELAEKNIITLYGNGQRYCDILSEMGMQYKQYIGSNTNLPLFVLKGERGKNGAYALTYSNKLVHLSDSEYYIITKELYKRNIEIRKLIKCFIVFSDDQTDRMAFCFMPEYAAFDESLEIVNRFSHEIFIAQDKRKRWIKLLSGISHRENAQIRIIGLEEIQPDIDDMDIKKNCIAAKKSQVVSLIKECNSFCINYMLQAELESIIMRVINYYVNAQRSISKKIELLAKDSVHLRESEVKTRVNEYRNKLIKQREQVDLCKKNIEKVIREILELASSFEILLSGSLEHDLGDDYYTVYYADYLRILFFQHIESDLFEKAKKDILRLSRINYPYAAILKYYSKYIQNINLVESERRAIKNKTNTDWVIAKIKIDMYELLDYSMQEMVDIVNYVPQKSTGKEWFFYGKSLISVDVEKAADAFMESLDLDYVPAGAELIQLAQNYPECKIDIEELAENLVPEANFLVGRKNLESKRMKAIVNLKMAASKGYVDAIILIADILFEKYRTISWQKMEQDKNVLAVNNVISLYMYLAEKDDKEEYRLRIGLMYCKLKQYQRAFELLKNINRPEAQYECAKMYQYGNGVAKDILKAKLYYSKIKCDYKDAQEQYKKICSQIEESEYKEKTSYSEKKDYSSSSSTYYEGSSFCFITTAACMALNDDKNCPQLNELRHFRDEHILTDGDEGDLLVKEYYRIGPIIVEKIDSEWNPFSIYSELWDDYIKPSCEYIHEEEWEKAKNLYIKMVKKMCERYEVPVDKAIAEKYSILI